MVKIFIYALLVIVSAVVLTLYFDLLGDPGYLLAAWGNYTFETSLFALIVFFIVFIVAIRLVLLLLAALNPRRLFSNDGLLGRKGRDSSRNRTTEGLMHFVRSDWVQAYKILERSFSDRDCTVVNFLAAAHAACEVGQDDLWEDYLSQAGRKFPAALGTVNTVRAELLMKTGHLEQSLAVLEQVRRTSAKDRQLLVLLKEVYLQLEDWEHLKELLPALRKADVLDEDGLYQLNVLLFKQHLKQQVEQLSSQDKLSRSELKALLKSWKKSPHKYHEDPELVEYFVTLLNDAGASQEASQVLESALSRSWNNRLLNTYGEFDFGDHAFQLAQAQDWLQQRPNDPQLLLVSGRLSMRNGQWDKAREYLDASIKIMPTTEACGELSRLLNALGETEESLIYYEKCVELGGIRLPDLPMPDRSSPEAMESDAPAPKTNDAAADEADH
ncbi:MAG: hypothetical protein KJN90_06060 [Gammaproteobacteria bacterium]|nr:hypothetical protein [Gammaproteobacteria bacterium]